MNYYSEVIGLLSNGKIDGREILIELSKKHPKYVYEAHVKVNGKTKREKILSHYFEGHSKFECIQLCGLLTGKELNDCKIMVEMILPAIKEKKKK